MTFDFPFSSRTFSILFTLPLPPIFLTQISSRISSLDVDLFLPLDMGKSTQVQVSFSVPYSSSPLRSKFPLFSSFLEMVGDVTFLFFFRPPSLSSPLLTGKFVHHSLLDPLQSSFIPIGSLSRSPFPPNSRRSTSFFTMLRISLL